ncbi:hypothetical protein CEXT_600991 [Caerostris extrusa]|uniref:Maturase K n=1 Tax=Caerostris extrusa TaxID=172846 RepID=A0AAV4TGW7_CAEEX|nr:hypothetical protein CEXT_600991 [Caerostris extrusa]
MSDLANKWSLFIFFPNEKVRIYTRYFFVHRSETRNIEAPQGIDRARGSSPRVRYESRRYHLLEYTHYLRHNGKAPLDKFIRDCFGCATIFGGFRSKS